MAGLGKRFYKSDFHLPKPLIHINNKPMFIQAAKSMPKSKLNIFICNKKIADQYKEKIEFENGAKCRYKLYDDIRILKCRNKKGR